MINSDKLVVNYILLQNFDKVIKLNKKHLSLQLEILESLATNASRPAFFINGKTLTYNDLSLAIAKIRKALQLNTPKEETNIGLVINDDLETYAAIYACWLEGKAYVPMSTESPRERNNNVIKQANVKTLIDSNNAPTFAEYSTILSRKLEAVDDELAYLDVSDRQLAYIFFTSGTTGVPKGVPISFSNLEAFCTAFDAMSCQITENDRCLQMFELTFDLSVMSFLIPILKGACVYTIPKDEIKYSYVFELMEDQKLTFALMVPSIIHYLRPYFEEINCPDMKYSLFCGEALPLDVTEEWAECLPNAQIMNVYGPTEDTIFCTELIYKRDEANKSYNGILSIGKPMKGALTVIVNDKNEIVPVGEKGELCLAGGQLTSGYWRNPKKNAETFFNLEYNGITTRFYRTGDLCFMDEDGDILYSGRVDFQAKIQGFRVELSEVELYAKERLNKLNAIAVAFANSIGNTEIGLVIESDPFDTTDMVTYMKSKIPGYMIPTQIKFSSAFPLNTNGKTDRNKLTKLFK